MTTLLNEFRTADGSGNNQNFNAAGSAESRLAPANFAPGTSNTPIDGPNAREISNVVSSGPQAENHDSTGLSAMMYVWGQFIDHDLDHTEQDNSNHIGITIPNGDPNFAPGGTIDLTRFVTDPSTGTATNDITGWIDGSMIYGSDQATADSLRLPDGHLRTSPGDFLMTDAHGQFVSGDVRVGENPDLTSISTLFVREHNFQVDRLQVEHPDWSGDQLYQMARAIVTAEIENITYSEFLPHLLGPNAIQSYHGFNPTADPSISQEFTAAAFRFGHSIVSGTETKLSNSGDELSSSSLADAFTSTAATVEANDGIGALLRGIASDPTQSNDPFAVDALRNLLNAPPDFIDLIAIDIQRERDLGVGSLNQTREALGLAPYTDFNQISSDPEIAANLQKVFGSVDNVDLFIGGLAEDHVSGSMLGETFEKIIADQFTNLRDGDRLWWQNQGFDDATTQQIQNTTLSDIITRNTTTGIMQSDAFMATSRHMSDTPPEDDGINQLVMGVDQDNAMISGGPDDDTIVAGLGQHQMLTGDGGKNTFVFQGSDHNDTISDFTPGMDKIEFSMTAGDFKMATASDGHAIIQYGGNTLNLLGVNPSDIGMGSFILPSHA